MSSKKKRKQLAKARDLHESALTPAQRYGPEAGGSGTYTLSGSKFPGALGGYPSLYSLDYEDLRARSRIAYWESTQGKAMLGRLVDNVIGTGLSPQSSPIWELINSDDPDNPEVQKSRHQWQRMTDTRFMLWANSHEPDSRNRLNLWEKQGLEMLTRLLDGECFLIFRYDDSPQRMNPLKIQAYSSDQITQPNDASMINAAKARGNRIECGIELNADGVEVAIYLCEDPEKAPGKTIRIPFFGDSGRRFVLHSMNVDSECQVRGTPQLASVIHELRKITDMEVAELEAAVINGLFAVQSVTDKDAAKGPNVAAGLIKKNQTMSSSDYPGHASVTMPGIVVTNPPGTKLEGFNSGRPNIDVHNFIRNVMKGITSSMGEPISVTEMEHTASYSAARGALLQFWTTVEIWREKTVSQVLALIREAWFSEEVAAKRIKAPGYNGKSPVIRAAWLNCGWLGSQMPSLDAEKDARAADLRIAQGALTREKNAMQYNNSDYTDNVSRLTSENAALAVANAPLQKSAPVQGTLDFNGNQPENNDLPQNSDQETAK